MQDPAPPGLSGDDDDGNGQFQAANRTIVVILSNVGCVVSRCAVKLLKRQVHAAVAFPESWGPLRWTGTPITFGHRDLPQNMAGAGELPLMVSPTIANACIKHVLIDGGAGLNVLSTWAFTQLGIPAERLTPAAPFGGVGPGASSSMVLARCLSPSGPLTITGLSMTSMWSPSFGSHITRYLVAHSCIASWQLYIMGTFA